MESIRTCLICGASLAGKRERVKLCSPACHGQYKSEQARRAAEAVLAAGEKPCTKCGETKRLTEFYDDHAKLDGRRNSCITCDLAYQAQPHVLAKKRTWNRSEAGKAAQWRHYHLGNGKAVDRAYATRPDRVEKMRDYMRKAGLKHYHKVKDTPEHRAKIASEEFRAKRRERHRKWYRKPDVRQRVITQKVWQVTRRRTIKAGLPATLTKAEWRETLEWFGHRCAYCGTGGPLHQDHFIPLTVGGGFTASNIVPACPSCNGSKQDRMPENWCEPEAYKRIIAYLSSRVMQR